MAVYGWDGVTANVRVPITGGTVAGTPFTVPKGAVAMTIHCPTTAATLSIQALEPNDDQTSETWRIISAATGVTLVPLTAIAASNIVTTYSMAQVGGGVIRFLASSDLSASPIVIKVVFHMRG